MKRLYLIRGLPGSGKSELAKLIRAGVTDGYAAHIEADDFCYVNGVYQWSADKLAERHEKCRTTTEDAMSRPVPVIIVSNTFTTRAEMQPYYELAVTYGYTVREIAVSGKGLDDMVLSHKTIHGVPQDKIAAMRARWEA